MQPRFRSMWERYCRGVQAIVFVLDAADQDTVEQARNELLELLAKPSLRGIPLLVLGNKNDIPGALSTGEIIEQLDLKVKSWFPMLKIMVLLRFSYCELTVTCFACRAYASGRSASTAFHAKTRTISISL